MAVAKKAKTRRLVGITGQPFHGLVYKTLHAN
jgi:hypothetical protein